MSDDRTVLKISGADRISFLQGLISNNVQANQKGLVYAALLSPQGKYLFDFFIFQTDDALYLDVQTSVAALLAQRLTMYRLRADVGVSESGLTVSRGLTDPPVGAFGDPRCAELGWRHYSEGPPHAGQPDDELIWDALRVKHLIPKTGCELIQNESYILELGFERLHGVDFKKGCYVGQEVTARMKHKTKLKKGLMRVSLHSTTRTGTAAAGAAIERNDKTIGTLHTVAGSSALAYVRFDMIGDDMTAGDAVVTVASA